MLVTIRKRIQVKFALLGLFALSGFFTSCATKRDTAFLNDANAQTETALPWNEQQKWEREGQAGALNQQRR